MTEPAPGTAVKRKRGRPRRVPIDPTAESASAPSAAPTPAAPAPAPTPKAHTPDSSSGDSGKNLNELEERINDLTESWETESLFEDILDDADETTDLSLYDPEACTLEEAARYRQELRAIGPEEFCERTVNSGAITAKKLLTAFGVRPPSFLDGEPDESYYGLLSLALSRELSKRAKLLRYNTVDDAVHLLQTRKNIIVLTGAGISTSLGIPDFRSKDTGLYSRLAHLGLSDPQEVFDINVFRDDPTIFYSVARDILPSTDRFTPTHAFIAMLQQRGKLLTNYSQNIDNLEAKAGIKPSKLIQCHGSFATASCVVCGYKVDGEVINPTIKAGRIPRCPECAAAKSRRGSNMAAALAASRKQRKLARDGTGGSVSGGSVSRSSSMDNSMNMDGAAASAPAPAARGRGRPRGRPPGKVTRPRGRPRKQHKRGDSSSDDDEDDNLLSGGVMKPDITFFGESLPDEFSRRLTEHDRDKVDLVVVIGTSLKVAPVSEVVPYLPAHIPQIYISRTPVTHINFDIDLLGDCDVVVSELCRRAGWDLTHEMVPKNQQIRVDDAVEGIPSRHLFTDVTPGKAEPAPVSTEALGVSKVEVSEPAREGSRQASRQAREASKEALKQAAQAAQATPADTPKPVEIKTDFVATIREIPVAPAANGYAADVGHAMDEAV